MNSKEWIQTWFIIIVIIPIIGGFNYLVDPYGLYSTNIIDKPKIKQLDKMRLVKAIVTQEIKPVSISLGTSRTERGYNPDHNYFMKPSYNLGTSGSSMYENTLYFKWALKQSNLKKVLLVADYRMFTNKIQKHIQEFETYFNKQNKFKYLFSIDTLKDSFFTLRGSRKPVALYYNNGQIHHNSLQRIVSKDGHLKMFKKNEEKYYENYPLNYIYLDTKKKSFPDFEHMVKLCYENDIKLDIIFGPSHIRQWESLDYYLGYDRWLQWKKDVVLSVNRVASQQNKKPFRIMDFSVYHPLTAETIPTDKNTKMKYHWESSHYKNELGLIVLDRLVGDSKYKDFGVELNLSNIENHLEQQKLKRKQYIDTKKYQIEVWGKLKDL